MKNEIKKTNEHWKVISKTTLLINRLSASIKPFHQILPILLLVVIVRCAEIMIRRNDAKKTFHPISLNFDCTH